VTPHRAGLLFVRRARSAPRPAVQASAAYLVDLVAAVQRQWVIRPVPVRRATLRATHSARAVAVDVILDRPAFRSINSSSFWVVHLAAVAAAWAVDFPSLALVAVAA